MAYRQRNIPVISKDQCEVQTQVILLDNYLEQEDLRIQQQTSSFSAIKLSNVYNSQGLLRPFSDHYLLRQFSTSIKQLRQLKSEDPIITKRLDILQKQINGLLKRQLLLNKSQHINQGSQEWSNYYSTLNQKQKKLWLVQNQLHYSQIKIRRLESQVQSLNAQLQLLRNSLFFSQKALQQNKIYSQFFQQLTTIINTSTQKGKDLNALFQSQILPLHTQFTFNLNNLSRIISKDVTTSIRTVTNNLAKQFDRLLKQKSFSEQKLTDLIGSIINNFKGVKGIDYFKNQFDLSQKTQITESKYFNLISLFKNEIQSLKRDVPNLKGIQRFESLLRKLDEEGVDIVECKGWMNLAITDIRVRQVSKQDTKLRQLIGILAGQFKNVYLKFPELKSHISSKLVQIFQSQALAELINGASIQRLKQIIVHQVETVRVNDVYQYESSKDAKTIFHLKAFIKALLEQLDRIKQAHSIDINLDEGMIGLARQQILQGIDLQQFAGLFRSYSKYVEVPVVLQQPVYHSRTYEKGVPIHSTNAVVFNQKKVQVVTINKQVPVYIEKSVQCVINNQVPVTIQVQKVVEVKVENEVVVDRIVETCIEVPVIRQKIVAVSDKEQIIKQVPTQKIVTQIQFKQIQKIVEVKVPEIIEVQRIIQKPVIRNQIKQVIKQVEIKVPYVIRQIETVQVQKRIPYIIEKKEIVEVRVEVPVQIKVPQIQYVQVVEYKQRPIIVHQTKQIPVPVQLTVEKELIREVPKQIIVQKPHFIKGDKQQVIRQVEVYIDRPIVQQILTTRNVQVEKCVPLYITEQTPIYNEIAVPYITEKIKELQVEKIKIVPVKEQIVKIVNVQKPVPVIVQKQVVKVQKQYIDRIIQKIVQVPRVVQVQKIVQKIVVVPRIIQKIVQVPKIIQKVTVMQVPILQLVQIKIPQIITQYVQKIVQVIVEKPVIVYERDVQTVQVQKIVEKVIEKDRPVQVMVQTRVPYEVIKEIPVETYRDRIQYQKIQIHETTVEPIQIQVPFIVQQKVPFIVQKQLITHEVAKQVVYQKIYNQIQKIVIKQIQKLNIKQITVQKAIVTENAVQVPGPQTITYVKQYQEVELIRQKLIKQKVYSQIIKEVVVQVEKIVPLVYEKIISVPVNQIITTPQLIEVPKIVTLTNVKQIPVIVPVIQQRIQNTIVQRIQQVQKRVNVPVQVQVCRQKIKEIVNQVKVMLTQQVPRQIINEIQVKVPGQIQYIELPGETKVQQLHSQTTKIQTEDVVMERLVQKIVMLPQIVEVVKHIHHIQEVNNLGIAVGTQASIHTQKYVGINTELRAGLVQLLNTFRINANRQPEFKNLITLIEKYIKLIDDWIAFPKLVQVPRQVIKEVQKQKLVFVPTSDREKEAALFYALQKCINQLKRIRDSHKITINLEQELLSVFFGQKIVRQGLDGSVQNLLENLKLKYSNFGNWNETNPFLVSAFMSEYFGMRGVIGQSNRAQNLQTEQIMQLQQKLKASNNRYTKILCLNRKLQEDNRYFLRLLEENQLNLSQHALSTLKIHRQFYDELALDKQKQSIMISRIRKQQDQSFEQYNQSILLSFQKEKESQIGQLVSKLNRTENANSELQKNVLKLQSEVSRCLNDLTTKNIMISQLQASFENKIEMTKIENAKNPNLSQEVDNQNKKLKQITQQLQRDINNQRIAKIELQRNLQSLKRQFERQTQRKERQTKEALQRAKREAERELNRVKSDLQKSSKVVEKYQAKSSVQSKAKNQQSLQLQQLKTQNRNLKDKISQAQKQLKQLQTLRKKLVQSDALTKQNIILKNKIGEIQRQNTRLGLKVINTGIKKTQIEDENSNEKALLLKNAQLQNNLKQLNSYLINAEDSIQILEKENTTLKQRIAQLEHELNTVQTSMKLQTTTFKSGFKSGISIESPSGSGQVKGSGMGSVIRSPKEQGIKRTQQQYFSKVQSPADRVKRRFGSSDSESYEQRQQHVEQFGSAESGYAYSVQQQQQQGSVRNTQMTLREYMLSKPGEDQKQRDIYSTFVMIAILDKVQQQVQKGIFHSYSPNNIYLINFTPSELSKLTIKLGAHITNKNKQGIYIAPEIHNNNIPTKKSVVFNLGVILDELIHGTTYFKNIEEILNAYYEFKVRGEKLNPILKNTLFEMMNKDAGKRLDITEARRRLSLQKYITHEGRGSQITTTIKQTTSPTSSQGRYRYSKQQK